MASLAVSALLYELDRGALRLHDAVQYESG